MLMDLVNAHQSHIVNLTNVNFVQICKCRAVHVYAPPKTSNLTERYKACSVTPFFDRYGWAVSFNASSKQSGTPASKAKGPLVF
jgi:hypothetical protein